MIDTLISLASAVPFATGWHDDGPGWWWIFPLFWIVVIATVILVLRNTGRWGPRRFADQRESAVEVLDRRFAEGELSLEEYRERRAILSEQDG
jgi:putative membrane protein